jgi:hypothetical protein
MVCWDNRSVTLLLTALNANLNDFARQSMHRANPYTDQMTARDVRRSTILDDGPLAFGVTMQEKLAAGWTPPAAPEV